MNKPSFMWRELIALTASIALVVFVMPAVMGVLAGFLSKVSLPQTYIAFFGLSTMAAAFILLASSYLAVHAIKEFVVVPWLKSGGQKKETVKIERKRYESRYNALNVSFSVGLGLVGYLLAREINGSIDHNVNEKVFMTWSIMVSAVAALLTSAFSFLLIDHFIVNEKIRAAQNMNKFVKGTS